MKNSSRILVGVTLICGLLFIRQPFSKHGFFQFHAWKTSFSVLLFFSSGIFFKDFFYFIIRSYSKIIFRRLWTRLSDFFDMHIIYRTTTNKHSWTCSLWTPYPSIEILAHSCLLSFPLPMACKWNQPRCLSNYELAIKTWYIYMMEFYLTIKMKLQENRQNWKIFY